MKRWTHEYGFTAGGTKLAEMALPAAIELLTRMRLQHNAARAVLVEAWFRLVELPKRTKKFQREYRKINGIKR